MSIPKDDRVYLWDMLTAARAVVDFTRGRTLVEYESDLLLRSAVERQIEIIGEAARRISQGFQEAHSEIQWRPIQAQRHVLAHDYGDGWNGGRRRHQRLVFLRLMWAVLRPNPITIH